jgi:hypothetical protein
MRLVRFGWLRVKPGRHYVRKWNRWLLPRAFFFLLTAKRGSEGSHGVVALGAVPAYFHRYVIAWPVMDMARHFLWVERDLRLTVSHSQ